jgi:hypothetical protein
VKLIAIIGDKEFETFELPNETAISDVFFITVANKELKKVTLLRFLKVKEEQGVLYYDLDGAFSLGEEHVDSVKRISFE